MLIKHEKAAVNPDKENGSNVYVKKYIYKTATSMFDLHAFHDFWEVWVRTDVVNGKPFTSFLVHLGMIKDTNAESFFSKQCDSSSCDTLLKSALVTYNTMFDWGVFKPTRLNITESDETSSISRARTGLKEWNEIVNKKHNQEIGVSFIKVNEVN